MKRSVFVSESAQVPFDRVSEAMRRSPDVLLGSASGSEAMTEEVVAHVGGIPIHDRFSVTFGRFEEEAGHPYATLQIGLSGDKHHLLIPDVDAKLEAAAESSTRTRLDLVGTYAPRFGPAGALEDTLVGHRAVEEALTQVLHVMRVHLESAAPSSL